jgi:hypothetical protein
LCAGDRNCRLRFVAWHLRRHLNWPSEQIVQSASHRRHAALARCGEHGGNGVGNFEVTEFEAGMAEELICQILRLDDASLYLARYPVT